MKLKHLIFCIFMLQFMVACGANLYPTVTAFEPATPAPHWQPPPIESCTQGFDDVAAMLDKSRTTNTVWVARFIEAGEYFLNNCMDPTILPADQPSKLTQLRTIAHVEPDCRDPMYPVTQFIDLNQDGVEELILHIQAVICMKNNEQHVPGGAGMSVIYYQDKLTKAWHGQLLWPCAGDIDCVDKVSWTEQFKPDIIPFNVTDGSTEIPYFVRAGRLAMATAIYELIGIFKWDNGNLEVPLFFSVRDYCHPLPEWEVTEEGHLFVPGVKNRRPELCDFDIPDALYVYDNGEFINQLADD